MLILKRFTIYTAEPNITFLGISGDCVRRKGLTGNKSHIISVEDVSNVNGVNVTSFVVLFVHDFMSSNVLISLESDFNT